MKSLRNVMVIMKYQLYGYYEVSNDKVQRQFVYFIVAICRNTLKSFKEKQ